MGLRFPFRLLTTGKKEETKIVELTNLMIIHMTNASSYKIIVKTVEWSQKSKKGFWFYGRVFSSWERIHHGVFIIAKMENKFTVILLCNILNMDIIKYWYLEFSGWFLIPLITWNIGHHANISSLEVVYWCILSRIFRWINHQYQDIVFSTGYT